jgi:single-strand DNA-binding protein
MNLVFIKGNLGKDPVARQTPSGKTVCEFSIVTNKVVNTVKQAKWHNIVAWGSVADNCVKNLRKGSTVFIEGELDPQSWVGKDGKKQYKTVVQAYRAEFNGSVQSSGNSEQEDEINAGDTSDNLDTIPF